jgi:hypothetical protein
LPQPLEPEQRKHFTVRQTERLIHRLLASRNRSAILYEQSLSSPPLGTSQHNEKGEPSAL